jgi:hypothetical protein
MLCAHCHAKCGAGAGLNKTAPAVAITIRAWIKRLSAGLLAGARFDYPFGPFTYDSLPGFDRATEDFSTISSVGVTVAPFSNLGTTHSHSMYADALSRPAEGRLTTPVQIYAH